MTPRTPIPARPDIVDRLLDACKGHPNAQIPWPHRLLHDARTEIEALREVVRIMDGAMRLSAEMAAALKPLLPKPETLFPPDREKWQKVVNVIFRSADYAEKYKLEQWGGGQ